ncbi:MAG TPA: GcrA family cell cycle regulator [Acetobacteraceae bacterium]|nr:GcrA family cell cycle regulator [Acetobacteraceae bacterium]
MQWTEETIAQLRVLWDEGHSTAEIGRRLGMSKNAVVGKAHRLDLAPRPSPIRPLPEGARPRPAPRRVAGPTLPPLASTRAPATAYAAPALRAIPSPRPAPAPAAPRLQPVAPRPYGRVITCCWPLGEPGTKEFRFCDVASVPGKPYCEAHAELAYVKVRDRREDAA